MTHLLRSITPDHLTFSGCLAWCIGLGGFMTLCLTLGVQAEVRFHQTSPADDGGPQLTLENRYLAVSIRPASSGRIDSFSDKHTDTQFIPPLRERVRREPLLPALVLSNRTGFADWFWGRTTEPRRQYDWHVKADTESETVLVLTYRSATLEVQREVRLAENSRVLRQRITVTNVSDTPQTISYWPHLVLRGELFFEPGIAESRTYLAAGPGGNTRRGRRLATMDESGVQVWTQRPGQTFFEPNQAWLARATRDRKNYIAMRMTPDDLHPDGFLYIWEGADGPDLLATLEMVSGQRLLAPKMSVQFDVDLAVWPQRGRLILLTATHALSLGPDGEWVVQALCDAKATTLQWQEGQVTQTLQVPAMTANQTWRALPSP